MKLCLALSIRDIAREFKIDKATIKHIIEINNIKKSYLSQLINGNRRI